MCFCVCTWVAATDDLSTLGGNNFGVRVLLAATSLVLVLVVETPIRTSLPSRRPLCDFVRIFANIRGTLKYEYVWRATELLTLVDDVVGGMSWRLGWRKIPVGTVVTKRGRFAMVSPLLLCVSYYYYCNWMELNDQAFLEIVLKSYVSIINHYLIQSMYEKPKVCVYAMNCGKLIAFLIAFCNHSGLVFQREKMEYYD